MLIATTFAGRDVRAVPPERVLDALERAAPEGVVLDDGLAPAVYETIAAAAAGSRGPRVVVLEAPCPRPPEWRGSSTPALCARDRDEAHAALTAAEATVERAGALGAAFVVVQLGAVRELEPEWAGARERFLRAQLDADDALLLRADREDAGERALDGARRALERLARRAETVGVTVCVRNPRRYV